MARRVRSSLEPRSNITQRLAPGRLATGRGWIVPVLVVLVGALIAQHYIAGLPMTAISSLMPLARLGDICLVGLVLLLGQALGCWVLRQARICVDEAERVAYTTALGLGILAYIGLALGLVGLYRPPVLLLVLMLLALMVRHELWVAVTRLRARFTNIGRVARTTSWSLSLALLVAIMALSWVGVLLGALTPPHHFDPLAYHLAAPQRFLHTGQIAPAPDVLFGNLPLTVELLYGIGLAFGSAAFGQLLHLAFAGLTGLALWALARRYYGRATAWLALALFLTTPLVAVWARVADIDLALSCFLLLATMATLRAGEAITVAIAWRWALLAGVFGGLALGAKYQAWFAVPLLGLMLVIERARSKPRDARAALGTLAAFGGAALAVAAPWYIKNWLVLGNPLWPLFWGGRDYSRQAVALTDYFASGMTISPRTLTGYLLLPLRTYTVGDIEQRLVILNPLFLLAPLVAFCRGKARRPLVYCGVLSAGLALGWAGGFQELRYLLPICAPLSLATAVVLRAALDRVRWQWAVRPALLGASVIALGLVILHVGADRPMPVLLGRESVDGYLRQSITTGATYRATQFLAERRQPGDTVLWFNDAQVFYVSYPVRPDHLDLNLILLMTAHPTPADAFAALQAEHVDYLFVNEANIRYRERFDPEGRLKDAHAAFDGLIPLLTPIYHDGPAEQPSIVIYQVPQAPQANAH